MADIHDRGKALATRMLAPRSKGGKGLELVLKSKVYGEYDPVAGGQPVTDVDINGSGLRSDYDNRDIDGSFILKGDVRLLVSPVTLAGVDMQQPSTTDHILFDGSDYTVISVKPWNFAGVTCGFEVQARGV